MTGSDPREIATRLLSRPGLGGLTGPTVSPVFTRAEDGTTVQMPGVYAAVVSVPKKQLYKAVKARGQ